MEANQIIIAVITSIILSMIYKPRELIDSLRDIIEELRNRGYVVDVSYSYKIKL